MALNFPTSPTANQIYTDTASGVSYEWITTYGVWRIKSNTVTNLTPANNWSNTLYTSALTNANAAANSANAYTVSVGAASNTWANSVGTSGNNYMITIVTGVNSNVVNNAVGANGWANALSTSDRAVANAAANSANAYTVTVGAASNTWANSTFYTIANGAIAFIQANGAYVNANNAANNANAYTVTIGAASNTWANTLSTSDRAVANAAANAANNYASATYYLKTGGTISGDVTITGNLNLLGNATTISSNNLIVGDSLIYLAANNYSGTDVLDIGFVANYGNVTAANVHTGLFRDATTKQYYLFQGYDLEPSNNSIVPYANNMVNAALNADLITSNLSLGGANAITWINSLYPYSNSVANSANAYALSIAGGGSVNVSTTGPTNNTNGSLWWNTNLGRLFIYYTDGDSNQWVEASPSSGSIDVELLQSYTNVASNLARVAFDQANAAYTSSNTKLSNSTVTLAGSLTTTGSVNSNVTVSDSKGDVRDMPVASQMIPLSSYTLTVTDTGKIISTNANIIIPNGVFSSGQAVSIWNNSAVTIAIANANQVLAYTAGTSNVANKLLAQRGLATICCVSANTFVVSGAGLT